MMNHVAWVFCSKDEDHEKYSAPATPQTHVTLKWMGKAQNETRAPILQDHTIIR